MGRKSTDENGENIYDDVSKHIYSNVPDGKEIQYDFMLEGGSKEYIYDYNIHSLLGALNSSDGFFENTDAWGAAEIKNIVLETANGLFYVSTDVGYFLCDSVVIREDGARYDYLLQTRQGVRCYYNEYYDRLFYNKKLVRKLLKYYFTFSQR